MTIEENPKVVLTPDQEFEQLFSPNELRKTWKQLKTEFQKAAVRDVIDYLDWRVLLDHSLQDLSRAVIAGTFNPDSPQRYELAKSKGAYRILVGLQPPEALVYRHIANRVYGRALPTKVKGAFFSRRHEATPVGKTIGIPNEESYERFFDIWIRYQQYRSRTLLSEPYECLVVTDISNYFDSIHHDLLFEYLAPLGLPRKAIALLGRLLERFKPASGHSANPKVGIPADDLDCSRQLAHVFLFEHDRRVLQQIGEEHYVRWMDDQTIGTRSKTQARQVVNQLTRSLAEQRLTLNAGKTKFLTPPEVAIEFHLDTNEHLERLERRRKTGGTLGPDDFHHAWKKAIVHEGQGNWGKILKRFYGLATAIDLDFFENRAIEDLVAYPEMADRVYQYFAARNRTTPLVEMFRNYVATGECLYESGEASFFSACASIRSMTEEDELALRSVASDFLDGSLIYRTGRPAGDVGALRLLYLTDGLQLQKAMSASEIREMKPEVVRAWLACCSARYPEDLPELLSKSAAKGSSLVARLAHFLLGIRDGSVSVKYPFANHRTHYPFVNIKYFDSQAWLSFELVSRIDPVHNEVGRKALPAFSKLAKNPSELRILGRISETLHHFNERQGQGIMTN